jgi:hypothetical protein
MDARISNVSRPDVVMTESASRPTPTPVRVSFSQVLAAGANSLVQGAELVAGNLPGSPIMAAALRGGAPSLAGPFTTRSGTIANGAAEGPGGVGLSGLVSGSSASASLTGALATAGGSSAAGASAADPTGAIDSSLQQSAQMNLYYLQVQQEVDAQNRSFTALSNVLKTEHDSAKAAIQNVHS